MSTVTTFNTKSRKNLEQEIEFLLAETGMSWEALEAEAVNFTLNDKELAIYRTIKSMRWILEKE